MAVLLRTKLTIAICSGAEEKNTTFSVKNFDYLNYIQEAKGGYNNVQKIKLPRIKAKETSYRSGCLILLNLTLSCLTGGVQNR